MNRFKWYRWDRIWELLFLLNYKKKQEKKKKNFLYRLKILLATAELWDMHDFVSAVEPCESTSRASCWDHLGSGRQEAMGWGLGSWKCALAPQTLERWGHLFTPSVLSWQLLNALLWRFILSPVSLMVTFSQLNLWLLHNYTWVTQILSPSFSFCAVVDILLEIPGLISQPWK